MKNILQLNPPDLLQFYLHKMFQPKTGNSSSIFKDSKPGTNVTILENFPPKQFAKDMYFLLKILPVYAKN
jgi:hypothetical protein